MTEQVQEQFSDSSHATEASMGFFEKTLCRQLDLSDQGLLKLESPSGKNTFGSDKKATASTMAEMEGTLLPGNTRVRI